MTVMRLVLVLGTFLSLVTQVSAAANPSHCPRPGRLVATSEQYIHDPNTSVAIGGYDPVAYYVDGKARLGKEKYQTIWCGVVWAFVNEGNLDAFQRDPTVYAPQLGGYGAMTVARGKLTVGYPTIWTIYKKRLYFFFSQGHRYAWLEAAEENFKASEKNWTRLRKRLVH